MSNQGIVCNLLVTGVLLLRLRSKRSQECSYDVSSAYPANGVPSRTLSCVSTITRRVLCNPGKFPVVHGTRRGLAIFIVPTLSQSESRDGPESVIMADSGSSGGQWNWAALSQSAADTGAQTAGPSTQTVVGQLVAAPSFVNALPEPQPGRQASGKRAKASDGEDVEAFSKLRITRRTVSAEELKSEMSGRRFISLASMDRVPRETFTDEQVPCVTIPSSLLKD